MRVSAPDMTEDEARLALKRLDPLWEELFPAEQARIIHPLIDCVGIGFGGADVRLKLKGLASLARDLGAAPAAAARAAASPAVRRCSPSACLRRSGSGAGGS
jgi:hypothetical protein